MLNSRTAHVRMFVLAGLAVLAMPWAWAVEVSSTFQVRIQSVADTTSLAGVLEGTESAEARARLGGTLEELRIERGAWVKKGDILGVIKDKKLPQQSAGLAAQVAAAALHVKRMEELLPLDAASQAQVDQAKAQLSALKAQQQNTAQAATDGAILAPFDGQVVALHAVRGAVIMPGESLATVAAAPLRVRLALPERHAGLIKLGDVVPVVKDHVQVAGTVSRVYPQVADGRIAVDVTLPETSGSVLIVGQKVLAQVATGERQG
ncbi:MAG: HlyD family efflux transporter periplasmic adaptor subunit, partial [Alphaproteobacteria bacterium]